MTAFEESFLDKIVAVHWPSGYAILAFAITWHSYGSTAVYDTDDFLVQLGKAGAYVLSKKPADGNMVAGTPIYDDQQLTVTVSDTTYRHVSVSGIDSNGNSYSATFWMQTVKTTVGNGTPSYVSTIGQGDGSSFIAGLVSYYADFDAAIADYIASFGGSGSYTLIYTDGPYTSTADDVVETINVMMIFNLSAIESASKTTDLALSFSPGAAPVGGSYDWTATLALFKSTPPGGFTVDGKNQPGSWLNNAVAGQVISGNGTQVRTVGGDVNVTKLTGSMGFV